MANQPTKYRKFVVGAASAALVASAVAPVASAATKDFSDIKGNTHENAINALVEAGVIDGYEDGTFKPNKTLTRSDVVKMMGKWLVSLGYEVPADYNTKLRFTDQTTKTNDELLKYSAVVKDNGVFNGLESGALDAAGDITRENMALVLVRAYDAVNGTDLVAHVADQTFDKDVVDRAQAKAEARPYIDVLDFFDITNPAAPNFSPKETTTRGQFASFLDKTSKVNMIATEATVNSVKADTQTTLVVTGTGLNHLKAEDFTIENNSVKSVVASADAKTATVTLNSELVIDQNTKVNVDGKDYTVKYSIDAKKISVVETTYDDDTKDQYVVVTVDGKTLRAQELINAGYTVKFESFPTKAAQTALTNLFSDDETGKLSDELDQSAFLSEMGLSTLPTEGVDVYVKVTAVKGTEVISSEIAKVKIQNIDLAANAITDFVLTNKNLVQDFEQNSSTLVSGEKAEVSEITVKAGSETEDITTGYTLESSNKSVFTVNGNEITAQGPGTATLTIKYGGVTKTQTITVKNEKREMNKVELAKPNLKVGKDQEANSKIYLYDQYGDPMADTVTVKISDTDIIEVKNLTGTPAEQLAISNDPDNETKIVVEGKKQGSSTVTFRDAAGVKIGTATLKVDVSENTDLNKFELKVDNDISDTDVSEIDTLVSGSGLTKDDISEKLEIDLAKNGEKYVKIDLKALNAQGFELKGDETEEANYTAKVNPSRAGVIGNGGEAYTADGFIVVEAGALTGSATIEVTSNKDSKVKATVKVNVVDKGYNATDIIFKAVANPTYSQTINYEDVLTYKEAAASKDPVISGLKLTKDTSYPIRLALSSGEFYIDKDANGTKDSGERVVGTLELTSTGTINGLTTVVNDPIAGTPVKSGDDGTLIFKVVDNAGKVVGTKAIDVDF